MEIRASDVSVSFSPKKIESAGLIWTRISDIHNFSIHAYIGNVSLMGTRASDVNISFSMHI